MKKKNIFKTLICMLAFAALPVTGSAFAEDVSVPDAAPAIVLEEAATTTSVAAVTEAVVTTTETSAVSEVTTTTTDAATTTTAAGETTTTAATEATTTAETVTTSYDPNRIAVEDVTLNATEADVAAGKTYQIKTTKFPVNATDNIAVRYISSDESVATVDSNGVVTAHKPGKVTITVIADSMIPIIQDKTMESYTVLVLDNSTSMRGDPMDAQKEAAIKFCTDALNSNNGTDYKFSIVAFGSSIQVASEFTNDLAELTKTINGINLTGSTNYTIALNKAADLLSSVSQNAVKNIVFCSDGLPNGGDTSSTGPFTSSDNSSYKYANGAVAKAEAIRADGINIYTLGFFHNLSSSSQNFANSLIKDMATQPEMSYIVNDPKQLSGVFSEVANSVVNYNRVATYKKTVDVEVTPAKAEAPAKKTEDKKTSDQDSPKTGDNNHNAALISIIFIGIAAASLTSKSRKTER